MSYEHKIFYIDNFTVSWDQIIDKFERLKRTNPANIKYIGDPNMSETACWNIAAIIVNEMKDKLGLPKVTKDNFVKDPYEKKLNQLSTKETLWTDNVDWFDQSDVVKKALQEIEIKYKKEQEEIKQKEIERQQAAANFWKSQQNMRNNVPPPKPKPIPPKPERDFRYVLGIDRNIEITEDIIKKSYYKKAKVCHPDIKGGSKEKMIELIEAKDKAYMFIGVDPKCSFH